MHLLPRYALVLAALLIVPLRGAPIQTEYKQADTQFYLRSDLFKADPGALVVATEAATNMGDSYLVDTQPHPPQVIYLQQTHDWLEPITPPNMPASLNCPSDQMQVREPQGLVEMALPSSPAAFRAVRKGMVIPNGAVLRAGDNSSAAVLFGGVDSVRLAPNTQAAVQMNVTGGKRNVEVDIRDGMVFSKVGQRLGEKETYAVHTPFGVASAHGTDYVTVVLAGRVDVWVAQGTVELASPEGGRQVTVSTGNEPLKVMRNPVASDDAQANAESAESLTALLNFIPMANQKLKALADREHNRRGLTATEKEYMGRIRKVTSLIRLATLNAPPSVIAALPPSAPVKPVVLAAPPAPKPVKIVAAEHYPVAKPVNVVAASTIQAAPVAKTSLADKEARPTPTAKAKIAGTVLPSTTPPTQGAMVKAKKTAKPKHTTTVADDGTASKFAPPPDSPYPRAKPVNPSDLVSAPAVMSTPPPARPPTAPPAASPPARPSQVAASSAEGADPNSLGAQLNPFHQVGGGAAATLNPRVPGADLRSDASPAPSPMDRVTGKMNDTAP